MKPELNQAELENLFDKGETVVIQYRSIFTVEWSHGVQSFVLTPRGKYVDALTRPGRFVTMKPQDFKR